MSTARKASSAKDYRRALELGAPRERVFEALSTLAGVRGWWTALVSGDAELNGVLRLRFRGLDEHIDLRVSACQRPSELEWTVLEHSSLEEWNGTRIQFRLSARSENACTLAFRHLGLSPALICYEDCEAGWDRFLDSLTRLVERGKGRPFA
jgi:uncharacterized protein YndB with AHSA1/START domain